MSIQKILKKIINKHPGCFNKLCFTKKLRCILIEFNTLITFNLKNAINRVLIPYNLGGPTEKARSGADSSLFYLYIKWD